MQPRPSDKIAKLYRSCAWLLLSISVISICSVLWLFIVPVTIGRIRFSNQLVTDCLFNLSISSLWIFGITVVILLPGKLKWFGLPIFLAAFCTLPFVLLALIHPFSSDLEYTTGKVAAGQIQFVNYRSCDKHGHFSHSIVQEQEILPGVLWSRLIKHFEQGVAVYLLTADSTKLTLATDVGRCTSSIEITLSNLLERRLGTTVFSGGQISTAAPVYAQKGSVVFAKSGSTVYAKRECVVHAEQGSLVKQEEFNSKAPKDDSIVSGENIVYAKEKSTVYATNGSTVYGWSGSSIIAENNSLVHAEPGSIVLPGGPNDSKNYGPFSQ